MEGCRGLEVMGRSRRGGGEGREDPKTFPSKHYIKISNQLYSLRQVRNSLTMWFFFFCFFAKIGKNGIGLKK